MAASWRLFFVRIYNGSLKPGIYMFSGSASIYYWNCPFSCAIENEATAAILILSLVFYYWHTVLVAVVSDLWPF